MIWRQPRFRYLISMPIGAKSQSWAHHNSRTRNRTIPAESFGQTSPCRPHPIVHAEESCRKAGTDILWYGHSGVKAAFPCGSMTYLEKIGARPRQRSGYHPDWTKGVVKISVPTAWKRHCERPADGHDCTPLCCILSAHSQSMVHVKCGLTRKQVWSAVVVSIKY